MARETKIGVALMALLLGVFGFVAYKKWDDANSALAAKDDAAAGTAPPAEKPEPAVANAVEPPGNPFAATEPAAAPIEQAEPTPDPFADPAPTPTGVPIRPVSATAATPDAWAEASPAGQGEPVAQQEPAGAAEEFVPVAETEPIPADPGVTSGAGLTPDATADPLVADADPFGDAAASAMGPGSEPSAAVPMPTDDPFGNAGDVGGATATAAADADDPFGDASEPASEPLAREDMTPGDPFAAGAAAAQPGGGAAAEAENDAFADTPAATVASAEPPVAAEPTSAPEPAEDPFGDGEPIDASTAEVPDSEFANAFEPAVPVADEPVADEPALAAEPAETAPAAVGLAGIDAEPAAESFEADPVPRVDSAAREDSAAGRTAYSVVADNDTYWSISQRTYGTPIFFQALAKYNEGRVRDPKRLRPGMKILTPPASELTTRFPNLVAGRGTADGGRAAADAPPAGFLLDENRRPAYRVAEGDTLGEIAQTHLGRASRWVQIYNLNRQAIPDVKSLKPGIVLKLPADASRVRLVPEG